MHRRVPPQSDNYCTIITRTAAATESGEKKKMDGVYQVFAVIDAHNS